MRTSDIIQSLYENMTDGQKRAISSKKRKTLVVAGAGSGKTEVMARRIAWWIAVEGVPKEKIVAFTFTDRAAEELKLRVRSWVEKITPEDSEPNLGDMYVGTIHSYCILKLREFWPDVYHNYDILDENARVAFILRGYNGILGMRKLETELSEGRYATIGQFFKGYDQLHEHDCFSVKLSTKIPPIELGANEQEWCKKARLLTKTGKSEVAKTFSISAARYYAYLRCRRFLDFSTSQSEFINCLRRDNEKIDEIKKAGIHLLVDESQDINPVQRSLMDLLVNEEGRLTAVGDHRQAIYSFRGAKVDIIAQLWEELKKSEDGEVIDLEENFRSTPRIIDLANRWANTIQPMRSMKTQEMLHGNKDRKDTHPSHVALIGFDDRLQEAKWIADAIKTLVPDKKKGATHDRKGGGIRGLALSDIAVLVRSTTDIRMYMDELEAANIPAIVKSGPDLFSQPEVLLLLSALAITAGVDQFMGGEHNPKSLPARISTVLGCNPDPESVLHSASEYIREINLPFKKEVEQTLLFVARAIHKRISDGVSLNVSQASKIKSERLRKYLTSSKHMRRVFPQTIYHMLLEESCIEAWDQEGALRGQTAMFHLGALSKLVTSMEMPGWTSASDYHWQIIGLCQYGSVSGKTPEQPLMVQPDAVTISTIHGVKGLEFPAVFLADVNARRFPSSNARKKVEVPLDGKILEKIDIAELADNENYDGERRLMYVALTRAERFMVISHSGKSKSKFIKEITNMVSESGGNVTNDSKQLLKDLKYSNIEIVQDVKLSTSFSELRYYLKCPHDFYLRKVLGFSPTIDQAFGYGRGVHNLMRAVHSDPKKWAELAKDKKKLKNELEKLIKDGLFYLRYTTGEPATNMHNKGVEIIADYIDRYSNELEKTQFEAEKEFETILKYEDGQGGVLISGAIDVIRQDNPPRVALIDFKSGHPESDNHQKLDEDEMKLQVGIYAIAAKKEMEYQPEKGLVRYLGAEVKKGEVDEMDVPLTEEDINEARKIASNAAMNIRERKFHTGPKNNGDKSKTCIECDFLGICGRPEAIGCKSK